MEQTLLVLQLDKKEISIQLQSQSERGFEARERAYQTASKKKFSRKVTLR
jgi:HSP20 family molecular chaperone IbpA